MVKYTYQESVQWLRLQPEYSDMVKFCYLDEDNIAAAKRFALSEEFTEVISLLRLSKKSKQKVLDVGCGNGIASYAFASLGHNVVAVDPDPSEDVGLKAVQKLAGVVKNGSILTTQTSAESLPFPNYFFDIVYARQALHHFEDLHKGIAECSRVLKPAGLFLATRDHVISDSQQRQKFLEDHLLHKLHEGENAYKLDDYLSAIKQSNLKIRNCLAPFDTVINHFPSSNAEVKDWLFQGIRRRFGKEIASILIDIPYIEKLYRYYLSRASNHPGRLYSFLCIKKQYSGQFLDLRTAA